MEEVEEDAEEEKDKEEEDGRSSKSRTINTVEEKTFPCALTLGGLPPP